MSEKTELPDTCDGIEQEAFEEWASSKGLNMSQHPLHYLFLDPATDAARNAWKAGLMHCRERMVTSRPAPVAEVKPLEWEWRSEYGMICQAKTTIGTYSIHQDEDSAGGALLMYLHLTEDGDCTRYAVEWRDYVEAEYFQSIAQAGYERRILSALTPQPTTVEQAARVLLDACPNPIFDQLKPVLIGEFSQQYPFIDEEGEERTANVNVSWVVTKDIIEATLRALAGGGHE